MFDILCLCTIYLIVVYDISYPCMIYIYYHDMSSYGGWEYDMSYTCMIFCIQIRYVSPVCDISFHKGYNVHKYDISSMYDIS
jgi:hypothetical protein